MAKQPFVRTANFTDISKKMQPIAGRIAQNQTLGDIPQLATAMSSNEQILKANPARPSMLTTTDSPTKIGSGFLAEDKRELNSDETEFAMENFARLPEGVQKQLILSGQAPQQYMSKDDVKSFLTTYNTTPDQDYGQSIPADRDLMNKTYGVSGTDLSKETVGALPKPDDKKTGNPNLKKISAVDYAKQIADGLYDNQTGSEPDWGVASLLYFSKMAELASQPGATALGAAGAAGTAPAAYLMQKEKEKAAREDKKSATIASLVPSIITAQKGKTGKMNVIVGRPILDKDGKQKKNEAGLPLYQHYRQDSSGNILEQYEAPKDDKAPKTIIDIGKKDQENFGKGRIKIVMDAFEKQQIGSSDAIKNRSTVERLITMVTDPNFDSGWGVELKNDARQIGKALGFEINEDALASAQAFRAESYKLVLGSVSQMKGALSDKELDFLKNMNPSLAMSTNANKILLYTMKHALDKAASFNAHVRDWEGQTYKEGDNIPEGKAVGDLVNGTMKSVQDYNKMIDNFEAKKINQLNPKDYIMQLAGEEETQLILAAGGEVDDKGDYIEGTLSNTQIAKISTKLEQKYSLSLLDRTFKNYFETGENAYKRNKR